MRTASSRSRPDRRIRGSERRFHSVHILAGRAPYRAYASPLLPASLSPGSLGAWTARHSAHRVAPNAGAALEEFLAACFASGTPLLTPDGDKLIENFSVGDAETLNGNFTAAPTLAGTFGGADAATTFDWGLPFYFGRSVYTVIQGDMTKAGTGPYVAF